MRNLAKILKLIVISFIVVLGAACIIGTGDGGGGGDDGDGGGGKTYGQVTFTGDRTAVLPFDGFGGAWKTYTDLSEGNLQVTCEHSNDNWPPTFSFKTASNEPGVYPLNWVRGHNIAPEDLINIMFQDSGQDPPNYYEVKPNTGNITIIKHDSTRIEVTFETTFEEFDNLTLQPTGKEFSVSGNFSVPYYYWLQYHLG